MKPKMLNIVCAYPQMVAGGLGAGGLNIAVIYLLISQGGGVAVLFHSDVILPLAVAFIPTTLLGCIVGLFTCWPLTRSVCSKFNGAPFRMGDIVLILSGPHKGKVTKVYETSVGQGGCSLVSVELGLKSPTDYSDLFQDYAVLRIDVGERDAPTLFRD